MEETVEMPESVEILASQHPIVLPNFTAREELVCAHAVHKDDGMALRRVYGAVLGLCTSLGAASRASFARSKFDVLAYGGDVYGYLREQGAAIEDLVEAGAAILVPLAIELFPREEEVADRAADFPEDVAPST